VGRQAVTHEQFSLARVQCPHAFSDLRLNLGHLATHLHPGCVPHIARTELFSG
jgi:hypothetical protein